MHADNQPYRVDEDACFGSSLANAIEGNDFAAARTGFGGQFVSEDASLLKSYSKGRLVATYVESVQDLQQGGVHHWQM